MSGGQRYWNEETQRWEDATTRPAPATAPAPALPERLPPPSPVASSAPATPGASTASEAPAASNAPVASEAPGASNAPVASEAPSDSEAPVAPSPAPPLPSVPPVPAEFAGPPAASEPDAGWRAPTVPVAPAPEYREAGRGEAGRGDAGRGLWWKVAVVSAVVGVGVAVGVVKLGGGSGSDASRTSASTSPSTGAAATAQPPSGTATPTDGGAAGATASASASSSASAAPAGYHTVADPAGFTIAVPDGWQRSERSTGVFYATDGDRRLLQIFVVTEAGMTPYEAVRQSSANLSRQPAYEEISLDGAAAPSGASSAVGKDAARLVYAYDSEKLGERRQVVEYAFTADDGKKYAVLAAGPATDWPAPKADADTALRSFATH
ncbi:hypothetical protein ACH4UM_01700 [Streptomyces sp. NPDC020801]|uniref:hypothetical protein n=1 Tax=Streptomyces sp. NPDC020801 TaxID=3365093 RepID=UPI0037B2FF4F